MTPWEDDEPKVWIYKITKKKGKNQLSQEKQQNNFISFVKTRQEKVLRYFSTTCFSEVVTKEFFECSLHFKQTIVHSNL